MYPFKILFLNSIFSLSFIQFAAYTAVYFQWHRPERVSVSQYTQGLFCEACLLQHFAFEITKVIFFCRFYLLNQSYCTFFVPKTR